MPLVERAEDGNGGYSPVITSASATPAFCGPPPGRPSFSPVTLISPPMPWMMKS